MFYIDPLREETLFLDPWLVVYHDILTEKEIAKIKELATPRLHRATAYNLATGRYEAADYRVSKSSWLRDTEDPMIRRISLRTAAFCNLTLDTVEELQVVNYGIGGQYEPHYDFARETEPNSFDEWRGNRILTAIYYIGDVLAGGYTVFPELGIKVEPTKNSVGLWYNLLASGDGDYRTRHAACPVLTGSKWVANKWFHIRGQEFHRRCGLSKYE
jgi:prolyl 4-hydroxylase